MTDENLKVRRFFERYMGDALAGTLDTRNEALIKAANEYVKIYNTYLDSNQRDILRTIYIDHKMSAVDYAADRCYAMVTLYRRINKALTFFVNIPLCGINLKEISYDED